VDLVNGRRLAETAFDNPQLEIGADVLARIHHADGEAGGRELQALIVGALNRHARQLCRTTGTTPEQVYALAVAGNTAMTHLLLGLDAHGMIREPYIPAANRLGLLPARAMGLELNPAARVLVFPNVGSYFGGDLIAGILHAGLHRAEGTALLVDVGTNAEVVVGNASWLMACAGAAGPALEGGVTRMGMMAGPGVIDRVVIEPPDRTLRLHTIGDRPPVGICGSGLIDLAAHLFLSGMVDVRGKFVPAACRPRLVRRDGIDHLELVAASASATGQHLSVTQVDLDSLVRSKAAMFTILETLLTTVGITWADIQRFHVAGTFGSFIDPEAAITIGMLPDLPREVFHPLGNSSLEGATLALRQGLPQETIDELRDRITYLELNVNQEFMNRFSAAKFLPHTDVDRFPSIRPWASAKKTA
jgi:uncharacterized 2Fe-2S/4Fe-4S cluster protein (DUF4445 family)